MLRDVMVLRKWLPPILWMALIFYGSTDVLSGDNTGRIIEPFLRWVSGGHLNAEEVRDLHFFIRKCGHVTEYAVLSVLFWFALGQRRVEPGDEPRSRGGWLVASVAAVLAAGYAALDEYHQSFVPSRTASWHDVAIDAVGAVAGLAVLAALRLGWGKFSQRRTTGRE